MADDTKKPAGPVTPPRIPGQGPRPLVPRPLLPGLPGLRPAPMAAKPVPAVSPAESQKPATTDAQPAPQPAATPRPANPMAGRPLVPLGIRPIQASAPRPMPAALPPRSPVVSPAPASKADALANLKQGLGLKTASEVATSGPAKPPAPTPRPAAGRPLASGSLQRPGVPTQARPMSLEDRLNELQSAVDLFDDGVPLDGFQSVNDAQVVYQPMSKVNPTGAVVPRSIAFALRTALEELQSKLESDLDSWVAGRLGWTVEEMGKYLTSEQIDAVALSINASDEGIGLLIADQTGFGKGRILAATARANMLSGKPVIFMTEKANLFSDFWRDVMDIGSADLFGEPLILNEKDANGKTTTIVDVNTKGSPVLHKAPKKAFLDQVIKDGKLPEGCKIMFCTYSQFNRRGTKKADFLKAVAQGAHVICDESHNMVGDSATSATVGEALDVSASSTYSSATYGRNVVNLSVYRTVFPWLKSLKDVEEMTPAQRRALAEASVVAAVRRGSIIRREHDLSNMVLELFEMRGDAVARNRQMADRLAPILSSMARMARRVDKILDERNEGNKLLLEDISDPDERKKKRETWSTANFGARLGAILGQFTTALKVDLCVERCVDALKQGKRPVVVIESTMESLMRELSKDTDGAEEEADDIPQLDLGEDPETAAPVAPRPPTFQDALQLMLTRMQRATVRRGGDKTQEDLQDSEITRLAGEIQAMIEGFPEISLSPIDDIRDRVEEIGRQMHARGEIDRPWSMEEISARQMRVRNGSYEQMPNTDRNVSVGRFQNNEAEGIILTRAASTGLSLHDKNDDGQRVMIELRAPANIVERVQMWGRVFRRGQVTEPLFEVLSTGLPFEQRYLCVQNKKVLELCASVTGAAASNAVIDVEDPVDLIGNEIAFRMLEENPMLAEKMAISLRVDAERAERELYFVNKLMQRLAFLNSDTGDKLYRQLVTMHRDAQATSKQADTRNLQGSWSIVQRVLFQAGDGSEDPVYGRPVALTRIRRQEATKPWDSGDLQKAVRDARQRLSSHTGYGTAHFRGYAQEILARKDKLLTERLPKRYKNLRAALIDRQENPIRKLDEQFRAAAKALEVLEPGCLCRLPIEEGELDTCAIIDVHGPEIDECLSLTDYRVSYIAPGDEKPRTIALDAMVRNGFTQIDPMQEHYLAAFASLFDGRQAEMKTVERMVLDGNPLMAALISQDIGGGSSYTYVADDGKARTGIVLPKALEKKIMNLPGKTRDVDLAMDILAKGGRIYTDAVRPQDGLAIRHDGGYARVTVPGGVKMAKPFETPDVKDITGDFTGDWKGREAKIAPAEARAVLEIMISKGYDLHFDAKFRPLANENFISKQNKHVA